VTTKEKLRQAQERVAEKRAQAQAARPANEPTAPRRQPLPPATPRDERPSALATAPPPGKVLLSRDDLRALGITYSRQHLHRLMAEGRFPRPVALGGPELYARKAWRAVDVARWLATLDYAGGEVA
jgi:predicted DNA-binding transcriptional regulator AlpA